MAENPVIENAVAKGALGSSPIITDKKALLAWRTNHDLHVLTIMKRHGLTKGQAVVQAYAEGVDGLNKRFG